MTQLSRRGFLATPLALYAAHSGVRRFHLSASPDALEQNPDLIGLAKAAGVDTIWIGAFLYGHWYNPPQQIEKLAKRIRAAGLTAELIFLPLGHPGDSLGSKDGGMPLIPPPHWKQCVHADGKTHWGTSLHAPATAENVAAFKRVAGMGFKQAFLDDDFRLATGPGSIGGCFCDEHWKRFSETHGYGAGVREQLAADIKARNLSPQLRAWVDFHCAELSGCFHELQKVRPGLGNMIMYLGSEKAGLRLEDYRNVPFRVGELMFADRHFDPVKGKTDELFSVLFHRRFAKPELAYSETTAFPADQLSAPNMAAKMAISTLADVRNTMMMSGMTPFPLSHWAVLGPTMKQQASLHEKVAGHKPTGPLKHFWGEHSRYVGDDKPNSLFLASGIPFEVCDQAPKEGWTFLSDADAAAGLKTNGTEFVSRKDMPETLENVFAFKRRIAGKLAGVPHVEQDEPAVCSWLPTARKVLVWNLSKDRKALTVKYDGKRIPVQLGALEMAAVEV